VDFAFSEEQEEFRSTLRRFLTEHAPMTEVRRATASPGGFDRALWKRMGDELGLQGVAIPEASGGQGFGFLELGIVSEELGRALVPSPFLSSAVLAAQCVRHVAGASEQGALLPALASGARIASVAWLESAGRWDADEVTLVCRPDGDDFALDGAKSVVVDGAAADVLLVVARLAGTRGADGLTLLQLDAGAPGVRVTPLDPLDPTRRLARLELAGARARALGAPGRAAPGLARALDEATVMLAFEMIGGAERCLEMAVAYAKERVQFGRPIGSFQAVKHKCAEVLLELESAKSAVYFAGWVADEGREDLPLAASLAKSLASDAYLRASAENVQIHGGVGFTWEYDPHLYYKRAKSSESLFGDPIRHRARIAEQLAV
jgi:alkylation response protein AidB-like acyl-CoA dehydrogenase